MNNLFAKKTQAVLGLLKPSMNFRQMLLIGEVEKHWQMQNFLTFLNGIFGVFIWNNASRPNLTKVHLKIRGGNPFSPKRKCASGFHFGERTENFLLLLLSPTKFGFFQLPFCLVQPLKRKLDYFHNSSCKRMLYGFVCALSFWFRMFLENKCFSSESEFPGYLFLSNTLHSR